MPEAYNYIKLKGRRKPKKIYFHIEPSVYEILEPDFSYAKYRNDQIAFINGIKQGYFEHIDDDSIDLSILFEPRDKTEDTSLDIPIQKISDEYFSQVHLLQQAYEDGLNAGENAEMLDAIITGKMKKVAEKTLAAGEAVKNTRLR